LEHFEQVRNKFTLPPLDGIVDNARPFVRKELEYYNENTSLEPQTQMPHQQRGLGVVEHFERSPPFGCENLYGCRIRRPTDFRSRKFVGSQKVPFHIPHRHQDFAALLVLEEVQAVLQSSLLYCSLRRGIYCGFYDLYARTLFSFLVHSMNSHTSNSKSVEISTEIMDRPGFLHQKFEGLKSFVFLSESERDRNIVYKRETFLWGKGRDFSTNDLELDLPKVFATLHLDHLL
jgi:hypothetical protein